ncbi:CDGSH iron-sulfur domain-containing protein 1, partial [Dermatophagoides pteronyssinus]
YEVLPWLTTAIAVCYGIYLTYKTSSCCDRKDKVNRQIDLDNSKVVHSFDIEDLDEKAVFCRCWKSTKFPYCDGSHNKHNESTGDNVGPLIIQKK